MFEDLDSKHFKHFVELPVKLSNDLCLFIVLVRHVMIITLHPIAIETQGPHNEIALDLLSELSRRITACSVDDRKSFFMFQCLSVCVQRFNAVLLSVD